MTWWNGDEWRWRLSAPSHRPTITVLEQSNEALDRREQKIKDGARVVPFGFSRVLSEDPQLRLWKEDSAL